MMVDMPTIEGRRGGKVTLQALFVPCSDRPRTVPMNAEVNPWLPYKKPAGGAALRLFLFHFAGGTASAFRPWISALAPTIEAVPVQLPGRERRMRESAFRQLDALLDALEVGIGSELEKPHAFFGHSMGALVAYGLARRRQEQGKSLPVHLFASARSAPHIVAREEPIHSMPAQEFRDALKRMGGTPPEVLEHEELMALIEPLVRADLELNEGYRYQEGAPLQCPITAFGGAQDAEATEEQILPWEQHTTAGFRFRRFPQGHFFIQDALDEVLREIRTDLGR